MSRGTINIVYFTGSLVILSVTESITRLPVIVNSENEIIVSRSENVNTFFAILNIFGEVDFSDSLESLELMSKYIISKNKRKSKQKQLNKATQ